MSSTTAFTSAPVSSSVTSTFSPIQTTTPNQSSNAEQQGTFYRNLFYILIGLLGAFAMVSFLSLLRARRRRKIVIREAERLGLVVPGMEGYIPLRERQNIRWTHADGSMHPDWWEIGAARWMRNWIKPSGGNSRSGSIGYAEQSGFTINGDEKGVEKDAESSGPGVPRSGLGTGFSSMTPIITQTPQIMGNSEAEDGEFATDIKSITSFHPLAVIPPTINPDDLRPPKPKSAIPFFPHHLAYRPEDLLPPPTKWDAAQADTLTELAGVDVDVVTMIRMPMQQPDKEPEEGEEVSREWNGICLGMVRARVGDSAATGTNVPRGVSGSGPNETQEMGGLTSGKGKEVTSG